jgi:hypothetical protein
MAEVIDGLAGCNVGLCSRVPAREAEVHYCFQRGDGSSSSSAARYQGVMAQHVQRPQHLNKIIVDRGKSILFLTSEDRPWLGMDVSQRRASSTTSRVKLYIVKVRCHSLFVETETRLLPHSHDLASRLMATCLPSRSQARFTHAAVSDPLCSNPKYTPILKITLA